MTTVKRFGNLRLAVFRDHDPPHFHVLGPECSVAVDLRTFKVNADALWALWRELNE